MPISQSSSQDGTGIEIVTLVGANLSGVPTFPINADGNGGLIVAGEGTAGVNGGGVMSVQGVGPTGVQLPARDIINVGSQFQAIALSTTAIEAKGATTRLINRKFLSITPTNGTIYWGTTTSVTTVNGSPLLPLNTLFLSFSDNIPVYIIAAAATDVRVLEGS